MMQIMQSSPPVSKQNSTAILVVFRVKGCDLEIAGHQMESIEIR